MLLQKIRTACTIINPQPGKPLTEDPDDTMFLECAQAAKADYLVTGDTDHFPKGRWKYTEIVTPRRFPPPMLRDTGEFDDPGCALRDLKRPMTSPNPRSPSAPSS